MTLLDDLIEIEKLRFQAWKAIEENTLLSREQKEKKKIQEDAYYDRLISQRKAKERNK